MHSVDPWTVIFRALEARGVVLHAADEGAGEKDLSEFCAGVEGVGAEVGVYF